MKNGHILEANLLIAVTLTVMSPSSQATPFTDDIRLEPCSPTSGRNCFLPPPVRVPGKEYSNHLDIDDTQPIPVLDPEQNLAWDGIGGREDTFDYSGSRAAADFETPPTVLDPPEVDALANSDDVLYDEVVGDLVWLLFSTDNDRNIYAEDPGSATGGIWASGCCIDQDADNDIALDAAGAQIDNPMDVDGLEVWGPDRIDDADRYSLEVDGVTEIASGRRVAVFDYFGGVSSAAFYIDELRTAISNLTGISESDLTGMDLDAMMTKGESIMWSVDPIANLDGGEIFVWNRGDFAASYLNHGGHLWNTAFDVMGTYNTASENVNALEAVAVSESTILALMGLGLVGIGFTRKKKQNLRNITKAV